jgi:hypothetical protein
VWSWFGSPLPQPGRAPSGVVVGPPPFESFTVGGGDSGVGVELGPDAAGCFCVGAGGGVDGVGLLVGPLVGGGVGVGGCGCGRFGVGLCVGRVADGTNAAKRCGVTRVWIGSARAGRLGVACVWMMRGAIRGAIVTVGVVADGPNACSVTTGECSVGSSAARQR